MDFGRTIAAALAVGSAGVAPAQEVTSGALQYDNDPALTIDHAVAYEY
jgi:hypothetical protein